MNKMSISLNVLFTIFTPPQDSRPYLIKDVCDLNLTVPKIK